MRKLFLSAVVITSITATAQNNTAENIIEGGKTLVELVRVFRSPKTTLIPSTPVPEKKDSCSIKNTTDLCIKNSTGKTLVATFYRRNGNAYEAGAMTIRILPRTQESLYELKAGIYKMKLETEEDTGLKPFREGEIRLSACENAKKEIKQE